jgi:nicotinamidase-related amidase
MIRELVTRRRRRVLVDVNTQRDFLLAEGSACIRNHRRVLSHIRRIMAWARIRHIPIISVCDVYPGDDGASCCIDGTDGQKKVRYTVMHNHVSFPADGHADLSGGILKQYRQVILNKRCVDPFDEPRIERLLTEVKGSEFIVVGAGTETSVMATVLGLLQQGKKVSVVIDAVGSQDSRAAELALRKMKAKGAKLAETRDIAGTTHLLQVGACDCKRCRGSSELKHVESNN